MSKKTTAILSLLSVASVFPFAQVVSAKLAANGRVSALFLVLVLALTVVGMDPRRSARWGRRILRFAAPALLVLLGCGVSWASFSLTFQGLVQTLNTGGSITLSLPEGVVVDAAGNVYIVDHGNNRIVEVNALGVASVVTITGLSPALTGPTGIAIDGSGNLYVDDTGNNRVVEITAAGAGSAISTPSITLSIPQGVAVDQSGDIFIADTGNNRIVEVTSGGAAAVLSITVASGSATLNSPVGLAVDVTGKLYIADANNNRIVTLAAGATTGAVVPILGGVTLSLPFAVAVDRMGNLIIADGLHNRIVEVDTSSNGTVLYTGSVTLNGPEGVAVDVFGTVYISDTSHNQALVVDPPVNGDLTSSNPTYSLNKTAVGFGHVPLGSSTGVTLTLPFTTGATALGSVQVLTAGVASLDFIAVPGGTCASSVGAGGCSGTTCDGSTGASTYCSVEITFLPTAPGLRMGSVVLFDGANNPILTVPLYGWGDAPVAALSPNPGSVISTGGVTLSFPFQVALDGAGNMYVADDGGNVTRIPAGGGAATVVALPVGNEVDGVAIDGAGNLFVSDHLNNRILVATPAGVVSVLTINGLSPVLGHPTALAFDGAGNLYISDYTRGRIVRVSTLVVAGSTSSGLGTVIGTGAFTFTANALTGLAVDAQGNIYADGQFSGSVVKVTAAGVASQLSFPGVTPALSNAQGVAVDAMGNVYVMDGESPSSRIVRLTTAGVASVLGITGLPAPSTLGGSGYGVTLDPSGNFYIPDAFNNRIVFVNVAASSLSFASTKVGLDSAAQTATAADLGNLPLLFAADPGFTPDFSQPAGSSNQCLSGTSLTPGTLCNVSVQFSPQSVGLITAGIVLTDNSLNLEGTTQSIAVTGTGLNPGDTTAVALSANPSPANIGQPVTLTATVTDTTAGHTATIPTGGVTFTDTVGSTVISLNGGSAVALNGAGVAVLSGVTLSGAGAHTITANYVGVASTFLASSHTTPLTVTTDVPTVAGPLIQPVQVASGQAGSVLVTVTGPYSFVALPTGSLSYSVLNSLSLSVASGTAPLTGASTNSTATVPLASSLAPGNYTVSVTYGGDSNYAASSAVIITVAVGLTVPTINWTAPGAITYGAALGGILDASAVSGSTAVAGSFTYTATLAGGSPVAVTGATVLVAGSYTLTATFTPTDPTTYTAASDSVALIVAKAAPVIALVSSSNPALISTAITFTATVTSAAGTPGGSVSFYDGETLLGSGTLALSVASYTTSSLALGAHSITSVYSGDSNFSALSSSVLTETVNTITTTTTLSVSPNPLFDGESATFTATVTPAPTGSPAGIISFYSGATLLGTGTLGASGVATLTTTALLVGDNSLTAVYPGNPGFSASTSAVLTETVMTAFTVTGPGTPDTVGPGGAATFNLTVPPLGGSFDSVVTLSATGLPPGATFTFTPPTVTPGTDGAPTVLTVQLATLVAGTVPSDTPANHRGLPVTGLSLAFGMFGVVIGRKRIPKRLVLALALTGLGVTVSLLAGCGGGFTNTPVTPAGNYTITVTGTSGSFQASTTVTLVVTK